MADEETGIKVGLSLPVLPDDKVELFREVGDLFLQKRPEVANTDLFNHLQLRGNH